MPQVQIPEGSLTGRYETLLAADSKLDKRLTAVLDINEYHGVSVLYYTKLGSETREYGALSYAIRAYNEGFSNRNGVKVLWKTYANESSK